MRASFCSSLVLFSGFCEGESGSCTCTHRKNVRSSEKALSCLVHAWKSHRQSPEITPATGGFSSSAMIHSDLSCHVGISLYGASEENGSCSRKSLYLMRACQWSFNSLSRWLYHCIFFIVSPWLADWPPADTHMHFEIRLFVLHETACRVVGAILCTVNMNNTVCLHRLQP